MTRTAQDFAPFVPETGLNDLEMALHIRKWKDSNHETVFFEVAEDSGVGGGIIFLALDPVQLRESMNLKLQKTLHQYRWAWYFPLMTMRLSRGNQMVLPFPPLTVLIRCNQLAYIVLVPSKLASLSTKSMLQWDRY